MGKMLIVPLAIMLSITMIAFLTDGTSLTADYGVGDPGTLNYTTDGVTNSTTVDIPGSEPQTFDIWSIEGAIVILIAGIALSIVAGIGLFGSGLSEQAQRLILMGTVLLGLWAVLTVVSSPLLFNDTGILGMGFYIVLTIVFTLGFVTTAVGSSSGE